MSLESLIPMVNRWLEGVNTALDGTDNSENPDDGNDDQEIGSPRVLNKSKFLSHFNQRRHLLSRPKYTNTFLDVHHKEKSGGVGGQPKRSYSTDDIPRITPPDSDFLSSRDLLPEHFSNLKRESIDSTYVQRPYSPTPSLPSSEQLSLCEEEDVLFLSPQFSHILAQRRASDGMLLPSVKSSDSESKARVNRPSSRYCHRPMTPSSMIRMKNSGLSLPPISSNNEPTNIPSICLSEKSPSSLSYRSSTESIPEDRPMFYPTPPSTPRSESKSNTKPPMRRRASLPCCLVSPPRRDSLPSVKEERVTPMMSQANDKMVVRRKTQRSKSLPNASLGSFSDWQQFIKEKEQERSLLEDKLRVMPKEFDDI